LVQIREVEIYNMTSDSTGQVSGAHLKLRGWLKRFPVERMNDDGWTLGSEKGSIVFAYLDQYDGPDGLNLWYLPIIYLGNVANGLILSKTQTKRIYQRSGLFRVVHHCDEFRRPFCSVHDIEVLGTAGRETPPREQVATAPEEKGNEETGLDEGGDGEAGSPSQLQGGIAGIECRDDKGLAHTQEMHSIENSLRHLEIDGNADRQTSPTYRAKQGGRKTSSTTKGETMKESEWHEREIIFI
jgi:hypothetical protein